MNAIVIDKSEQTLLSLPTHYKPEECTDKKIRELVVKKFSDLVKDGYERQTGYKKDIKLLGKGFWYANQNFFGLKEKNQTARIEHLRKNGSFYHGLVPKGFQSIPDSRFATGRKLMATF